MLQTQQNAANRVCTFDTFFKNILSIYIGILIVNSNIKSNGNLSIQLYILNIFLRKV